MCKTNGFWFEIETALTDGERRNARCESQTRACALGLAFFWHFKEQRDGWHKLSHLGLLTDSSSFLAHVRKPRWSRTVFLDNQVQGYIHVGVNHVDKADFLKLYQTVRPHAFQAENIISSFAAAGLVPYNPDQVMDFEHLNVRTPPPPSSSAGSTSSAVATPTTTQQLVK